MEYYGPQDQSALPGALAHLYRHRGELLRPGSSHTILPGGDICADARRGGQQVVYRRGEPGGGMYRLAGARAEAGLPFGFRPVRCDTERPAPVPFLPASPPARGEPTPVVREAAPPMRPARFAVPRDGFDEFGEETFVDGIVSLVWGHENRVCMGALSSLPMHGEEFVREDGATLTGLCSFVGKAMNPDGLAFMRFDTVFIGSDLFVELRLDGVADQSSWPAPNVIGHLGMRVLVHAGIPGSVAYVVSNSHGPAFVSGPTGLACTDEGFIVDRYCEAVSPRPRGCGEPPRGYCVAVREGE